MVCTGSSFRSWRKIPRAETAFCSSIVRGVRLLAAKTYTAKCATCIWGCEMAVEMVVDHWNPSVRRDRRETFCYGPKSCSLHKAGPTRKVPGRKGMSWEEEDWMDEDATAQRGPDD